MTEPKLGERVLVEWGLAGQVQAEVAQVYGPPALRHVLVRLSPEVTGDVVDEPVTISVPVEAVHQVEAA